jgi:hypothetical protein
MARTREAPPPSRKVRVERSIMFHPGARYAWSTFKARSVEAVRHAMVGWIDDLATAAKKAIDPRP